MEDSNFSLIGFLYWKDILAAATHRPQVPGAVFRTAISEECEPRPKPLCLAF